MKLTVIGSGSSGNCYVLQNRAEALIIEAGVPMRDILPVIGHDVRKVSCCLVSHEHGDHAGHVKEVVDYCIPVRMSAGTSKSVGKTVENSPFLRLCRAGEQFSEGRFQVLPFATEHDAAEPLGFLISHPETGVILFATDTYYLRNTFAGLNHIMIECNYIETVLRGRMDRGELPEAVAKRAHTSHMDLETCVKTLKANDISAVTDILLIHLSRGNGDPKAMVRRVAETTGRPTYAARKGLTLNYLKL